MTFCKEAHDFIVANSGKIIFLAGYVASAMVANLPPPTEASSARYKYFYGVVTTLLNHKK